MIAFIVKNFSFIAVHTLLPMALSTGNIVNLLTLIRYPRASLCHPA